MEIQQLFTEKIKIVDLKFLRLQIDFGNAFPTTTVVTLFSLKDGRSLVMCDELAENNGRSVHESWHFLAEHLHAALKLPEDKSQCLFMEHSGSFSHKGKTYTPDSVDQVLITWGQGKVVGVSWRPLVVGTELINKVV